FRNSVFKTGAISVRVRQVAWVCADSEHFRINQFEWTLRLRRAWCGCRRSHLREHHCAREHSQTCVNYETNPKPHGTTHDHLRVCAGVRLRSARRTQAFIFGLFCCFWLLGTLRGASTWDSIVSTGAQVDKKVVDITHYIRIGPKSGHHLLGCRVNVFAPTRYSSDEIGIADRF